MVIASLAFVSRDPSAFVTNGSMLITMAFEIDVREMFKDTIKRVWYAMSTLTLGFEKREKPREDAADFLMQKKSIHLIWTH